MNRIIEWMNIVPFSKYNVFLFSISYFYLPTNTDTHNGEK